MTTPATDPSAVPCDTCAQGPGRWCRTVTGAYSVPHIARRLLALKPPEPPHGARYDTARFDEATYGEAST